MKSETVGIADLSKASNDLKLKLTERDFYVR